MEGGVVFSRRIRVICQVSSSLAYCIAAAIFLYAQSVARDVFIEVCGRPLPIESPDKVGIGLMILTIPVLLVRSNAVVKANTFFALLMMAFAVSTPVTARTLPDECYTQAGSYEDHVSGIPEFLWSLFFITLFSYLFFVIDWFVRGLQKAAQFLAHIRSSMRPIRSNGSRGGTG
jgi:hypothetical protein